METKVCRCCGRELPLNHFKKTRYGGYVSVCTECSTKKLRENKQKRIEEQKQKVDDVRAENRQLCLKDFTARELMEELKRRGYRGKLEYIETHVIDLENI